MFFRKKPADTAPTNSLSPQDKALLALADAFRRERLAARRRRWLVVILFLGVFILSTAVQLGEKKGVIKSLKATGTGEHTAGIVRIDGVIGEKGGEETRLVIDAIRKAFESKQTDRVVLLINSPGGSPYTADRIIRAITLMREKNDKPLDAVVETVGASAAYMIAASADRIVASEYSMVGSIGAKMATWNFHDATEKLHVRQLVFASGALKNMLDPFSPPTEEGMKKADALVRQAASSFSSYIEDKRGDKLTQPIEKLSTGEVWMGKEALALGLIDQLGTLENLLEDTDSKQLLFKKDAPLIDQLLKGMSEHIVTSFNTLRGQLQ